MRIGIDFDNTIVSYDALFHKVAVEQGVVPAQVPPTKLAVREHLRAVGKEAIWTEMQGYVYGARMDEAQAYPGVLDFMCWARQQGLKLSIVSHKTRHPFLGPMYDLHQAASAWVKTHLVRDGELLVAFDDVYFELTKENKMRRIVSEGCDWFIDDLPEILQAAAFPTKTSAILFDPDRQHEGKSTVACMSDWIQIRRHFESLCGKNP